MFGSSLLVVCRRAHVLFRLSVFICIQLYPTHIVLYFCFAFVCFVYFMLPVSLDCPCLINPSVFSNAYLQQLLLMSSSLFSRQYFPIQASAIATIYLDDVFFVNLIPTLKTWNTAHVTLNNNSNMTSFKRFGFKPVVKSAYIDISADRQRHNLFWLLYKNKYRICLIRIEIIHGCLNIYWFYYHSWYNIWHQGPTRDKIIIYSSPHELFLNH